MAIGGTLVKAEFRENDQTFISRVQIETFWHNNFISWNLDDFCGIDHIYIPAQSLWKPDIVIEEMLEKDKFYQSPYLSIDCNGLVQYTQEQVVRSTCKMAVYKFPFDIQRCTISFKFLLYSDEDVKIEVSESQNTITEHSREAIVTQYEWIFIDITVNNKTVSDQFDQTKIIYTITMMRRSVLYIVNFLLPIFFFFCLDLASFLISDSGGEKLSYKVTVLLAVTVMQLILNDILPSSSDRVPLIAIYCIGIFALMMLSLMETILVMYLMEKDSASQDDETDQDGDLNENHEDKKGRANFHSCIRGMKRCTHCASDVSTDETSSVVKEGSCSQLTEVSLVLGKVSDELGEIEKTMSQLSSRKTEKKRGYWTRMAKKINKIFSTCYVTAGTLFLVVMLLLWSLPEDNK
ncbi:5-hydroxytryptamine receptor 3A-like [Brachyistius frenatus]|uniref:5-hydroxytryptamine receptor 3A-like n=1 Tax=Brachyistius frenatus TaxID=100188 RepID=UPI0037E8F302